MTEQPRHEQPMGQFTRVGHQLYRDDFIMDGLVYAVGEWMATIP